MSIAHALRGVGWVALALAMVGCDDGGRGTASTVAVPAPVASTSLPVIKIGIALSSTGKYAQEGADMRNGYDLWAEMANARGIMVGGAMHRVELVYLDDESSPETAAKQVESLVKKHGVRFLFGPYSSELTKSASLEAEKLGVIMVEGGGAAEDLFERGQKLLFAVIAPAGVYPLSSLEALYAKGARTVALAYENSSFPTSVAKGAKRWATSPRLQDVRIVAEATYSRDFTATEIRDIVARVKALDPDVFFVGCHDQDARVFAAEVRQQGFTPKALVMTVGPCNPHFVASLGAGAEHLLGPTQWHPSMDLHDLFFGSARDYDDRYRAKYRVPASYQAAEASACGMALMCAIQRAGALETQAVAAAMRSLDVTTFFGRIQFDDTGKNVAKQMGTTQVLGGEVVLVAPGEKLLDRLVYPVPRK